MQFEELNLGDLDKWAEPPPLAGSVRSIADFADEIIAELDPDKPISGMELPWPKTHRLFRARSHETTIVAGERGSWKSTVLSQILLHAAFGGARVMLVSLEMQARQIGARLVRQACCEEHPKPKAVRDLLESLRDRYILLNATGRASPRDVVALVRWAATVRRCQHVAIDNLTKVVRASNDAADEQQTFVNDVASVALDTGAHAWLVAHLRKSTDHARPTANDIRGSGTVPDQADNILLFWRNRKKEGAEDADLIVTVDKQRHGAYEGDIALWMHAVSMQLVQDGMTPPIPYAFDHGSAH